MAVLEAVFAFVGLARAHTSAPRVEAPGYVVRVEDCLPSLDPTLVLRDAGKLMPPLVEIVEFAVGPGCPNNLRHGLCELAEPALAIAELLLRSAELRPISRLGQRSAQ